MVNILLPSRAVLNKTRMHEALENYIVILRKFLCMASLMTITAITVESLPALLFSYILDTLVKQFNVSWVVVFIWIFMDFQ